MESLADISDAVCPTGYKREVHEKAVILYKLEQTENNHSIPQVTETIVIDEMFHVKLYKTSIPIPLPEWFRKGGDCRVKSKSILENIPTYIRNFGDVDQQERFAWWDTEELLTARFLVGEKIQSTDIEDEDWSLDIDDEEASPDSTTEDAMSEMMADPDNNNTNKKEPFFLLDGKRVYKK